MKKILFSLSVALLAFSASAQTDQFGIYAKTDQNVIQIKPTRLVLSSTNTVNSDFGSSETYTYGIEGAQSATVVPANSAFVVNLLAKDSETNTPDNWWFLTAKDGNDFALLPITDYNQKKDLRVLVVRNVQQMVGRKIKFPKTKAIPCTVTPLSNLSYQITPNAPLPSGNYCFYYTGKTPGMLKFFDEAYAFDFTVE